MMKLRPRMNGPRIGRFSVMASMLINIFSRPRMAKESMLMLEKEKICKLLGRRRYQEDD